MLICAACFACCTSRCPVAQLHAKSELLGPYWLSLVLRETVEVMVFGFIG